MANSATESIAKRGVVKKKKKKPALFTRKKMTKAAKRKSMFNVFDVSYLLSLSQLDLSRRSIWDERRNNGREQSPKQPGTISPIALGLHSQVADPRSTGLAGIGCWWSRRPFHSSRRIGLWEQCLSFFDISSDFWAGNQFLRILRGP